MREERANEMRGSAEPTSVAGTTDQGPDRGVMQGRFSGRLG